MIVSLPPWPKTWISARVGDGRRAAEDGTAPPLTRILPAASRLTVMLLSRASPNTERVPPALEAKTLVTAWIEGFPTGPARTSDPLSGEWESSPLGGFAPVSFRLPEISVCVGMNSFELVLSKVAMI